MGRNDEPLLYEKDENYGPVSGEGTGTWIKGEKQPSGCKDSAFAVVFLLHLAAIGAVVGLYGIEAVKKAVKETDLGDDVDYSGVGKAAGAIGGATILASSIMLLVMISCASVLIKLSLLFSVVMALLSGAFCAMEGNYIGGGIALLFFALSVCYACLVWSRIPFATANLVTALTAVKSNFGITLLGYFFSAAAFAWTVVWGVAAIGVYDVSPEADGCVDGKICAHKVNYGFLFLLFLSYYWVHQVFVYTVHVSVAGTVGTWWFVPEEASSCCSSAVTSSVGRSCTSSFGSVCLGALIVAFIKALRAVANNARDSGDANALLICCVDCLLGCLESIVQYFNQWAFVYVGVYGYGYYEAGKNVIGLFTDRGWEVIIADDLVGNALSLVSIILGLAMAAFGFALQASTDWFDVFGVEDDIAKIIASATGFVIGLVVSSITLSIVDSAVNATIVLFAEAPSEFADNHPSLSDDMRSAYMEAYPDCF